ncbi:MAG TPA: sulfotransferase [Acidimicrobiia bacterium]|nr:sulfotransferase [Acidimicrobiia bacterium]
MSGQVIIVGAPRSGTNMLRDVLTEIPGFATWPCDEINFLWRHGNRGVTSDELEREKATPDVTAFLCAQFDKIGRKYDAHTVVEKTCANSLRVGFVAKSFPRAKYLFIRRDGIDAAASAMQRWHAPLDLPYTAKKSRYVPLSDIGYYGWQFASNRLRSRSGAGGSDSGAGVSSWWGPRPRDYQELKEQHPLDEICMIQWQRCVEASLTEFGERPELEVHELIYEDFVKDPVLHLERVLSFLGHSELMDPAAVSGVSQHSVGKGRESLGPEPVDRLEALTRGTLRKLGYA